MKYYCETCKDRGMGEINPCHICQVPHLINNVVITALNEYGYPEEGYYKNSERALSELEIDQYIEIIYGALPEDINPYKIGQSLLNK